MVLFGGDSSMSNVIDWFEIPTVDLDRAVKFYDAMLGARTRRAPGDGVPQALLLVRGSSCSGRSASGSDLDGGASTIRVTVGARLARPHGRTGHPTRWDLLRHAWPHANFDP
jgi:catechol 2,3-dioxygenase-like lactoylglutathione lyase family enzyme